VSVSGARLPERARKASKNSVSMTCGFALKTLQQQSGSQFKLVSYAQQAADG
jgi:hypothetical protein